MAFSEIYSRYYDVFYRGKNYEEECNFIQKTFDYHSIKPTRILDAGCGTAGHLIPLLKRGYQVVGVDASEPMIRIARRKLEQSGLSAELLVRDVRELRLDQKFDAYVAMFAVLCYLTENSDLKKAFACARGVLRKGALLIFDFWYGPAVLKLRPSVRVKSVEQDGTRILAIVKPELDVSNHVCKTTYSLITMKSDRVVEEAEESHLVRFFFPKEIVKYLEDADFEVLEFYEFPHFDRRPTEDTWNAAIVARAR